MTSRSTSILTIAGITVVGGVLAYAVYFDYKRRNDVEFRKRLSKRCLGHCSTYPLTNITTGKEKKRVDKTLAQSKESLLSASGSTEITPAALKEALEQIKNEVGPETPEEKEAFFMNQVSMGEQMSLRGMFSAFHLPCTMFNVVIGPEFYLPAAMSFYRALRVYPSPVELIVIYQKTVPEPIFKARASFKYTGHS
jgi:import receptor subunit TOM20